MFRLLNSRNGQDMDFVTTVAISETDKEYVFYCDGKVTSRCNKVISQVPEFILLTTEIRGYRINSPLKVGEYYDDSATMKTGAIKRRQEGFSDDAFIVDYVRVFDEVK